MQIPVAVRFVTWQNCAGQVLHPIEGQDKWPRLVRCNSSLTIRRSLPSVSIVMAGSSGMTDLRGRTPVFDAHVDELPSQRGDRVIMCLEFFRDGLP